MKKSKFLLAGMNYFKRIKDSVLNTLKKIQLLQQREKKLKVYKTRVHRCSLEYYPEHLKIGSEVLTKEGMGKIKHITGDLVTVYLFKKYFKTFKKKDIFSYFVFVPNTKDELILTPSHLYFIVESYQEIEFTISSKNKAKLTEEYMENYNHFFIFNTYKYGRFFLDKLDDIGFKVIKK